MKVDNSSRGNTLDKHHTGLRQNEVDDNSSMETHTGPITHWVEAEVEVDNISSMGTHNTLDQHHTGLRQGLKWMTIAL